MTQTLRKSFEVGQKVRLTEEVARFYKALANETLIVQQWFDCNDRSKEHGSVMFTPVYGTVSYDLLPLDNPDKAVPYHFYDNQLNAVEYTPQQVKDFLEARKQELQLNLTRRLESISYVESLIDNPKADPLEKVAYARNRVEKKLKRRLELPEDDPNILELEYILHNILLKETK